MKVERIIPIPLDKTLARAYALKAAALHTGEKTVKAKYLGGGSFGRAFDLTLGGGRHIIVKLLRARDMLNKEVGDLAQLGEISALRMPKVLFTHAASDAVPVDCYGMEKIPGKPAMLAFGMLVMSKKRRRAFAEQVAAAAHAFHERKSDRFGDAAAPEYAEWLDFYKPYAQKVLAKAEALHAEGQLDAAIIMTMRAAWRKFDVIFEEKVTEACLIHGDLNVGNIMVGKHYGITGIIDPLNSMYADREYELFQFNNITGKRFDLCEVYKSKYGASKRCDQKLAFYALWHEVYCYIKAGVLVNFIMKPLVKEMNRRLAEL